MASNKTDLEELMRQSERNVDFRPRVYLYILTDEQTVTCSNMSYCMTAFAHSCLTQYFLPHTNTANVVWYNRGRLKQHLLARRVESHRGCIPDFIDDMLALDRKYGQAVAILFISRDASRFMETHRKDFLKTLAISLNTTKDKILVESMTLKPDCV